MLTHLLDVCVSMLKKIMYLFSETCSVEKKKKGGKQRSNHIYIYLFRLVCGVNHLLVCDEKLREGEKTNICIYQICKTICGTPFCDKSCKCFLTPE